MPSKTFRSLAAMDQRILFVTPPFTQLNTPYPATVYLKGYLNTLNIESSQADLGIEVILRLFSSDGLNEMFDRMKEEALERCSENSLRIYHLREEYINAIDPVISFLQDDNPTLAYHIAEGDYLPEASRFEQVDDLEWAFGAMGIRDKARYLATLFLEDIGDFITEVIDQHFGFSRYAEKLGMSATSFDEIYKALQRPLSHIDELLIERLKSKIKKYQPTSVGISVPFPGNLFGAFRCGQYIKANYPDIKVWMGGGYPNTELRSLKEPRVFEFLDYITLDDGETPVRNLIEYWTGDRKINELKRTFTLVDDKVSYLNGSKDKDVAQREVGTPDYAGLPIDKYLSVIEIANPMHRLWSDGRWNKLTLAHGCYWGKCTFCDISLDYIQRYEPVTAETLCDRIEELIESTGQNGFHFVDEAAPPALMCDLAIEILKRKLTVVWWTNIRFEQSFTADLCRLLRASGCIAVSGGLEVASDRLLALIKKGVKVSQVAQVTNHFTEAGIMVHAYLMYGFPTQTAQETIDSLEMVRQLFELGIVQSGYWHRFSMTAHSPVGLDPKAFGVMKVGPNTGEFANNDLFHDDPDGADHDVFGEGLRKSLFNYMHGVGFDVKLQKWFDAKTPATSIPKRFIANAIHQNRKMNLKDRNRLVWIAPLPKITDKDDEYMMLSFFNKKGNFKIEVENELGEWIVNTLKQTSPSDSLNTIAEVRSTYEANVGDFDEFVNTEIWEVLKEKGLLIL